MLGGGERENRRSNWESTMRGWEVDHEAICNKPTRRKRRKTWIGDHSGVVRGFKLPTFRDRKRKEQRKKWALESSGKLLWMCGGV